MKFAVFGLGNPGNEYVNTRHNVGFQILDKLATKPFESKRYALVSETKFRGRKIFLIKPQTYMNLSGKAVKYYVQLLKIPLENLLIVYDDVSLPLGKLRMRKKGSDGGHNGIKNIISELNTQQFPRLRIGIARENLPKNLADFVLAPFSEEEMSILQEQVFLKAVECIKSWTFIGIDRTMSSCNR